jgi:hypothetical protein
LTVLTSPPPRARLLDMQSEVTAHLAWRDVGDRGHDAGLDPAVRRVPSRDDDYGSKGARASPSPAYQPDSGVANRHACASRHTDHSVRRDTRRPPGRSGCRPYRRLFARVLPGSWPRCVIFPICELNPRGRVVLGRPTSAAITAGSWRAPPLPETGVRARSLRDAPGGNARSGPQ